MRTKALLSAAALAAGALTSMAQVYSANIVGYVNTTIPAGYKFLSNPLDASPDNSAVNVIPNPNADQTGNTPGPFDGCALSLWNGHSFNVVLFDSQTADTTTGFTDAGGAPVPAPTLGSGLGFLFNNGSPIPTTSITFVGQVRTGTNSLVMPVQIAPYAVGSMTPVSGGATSALGFNNPNADQTGNTPGPLDGCQLEFLLVNGLGQAKGYNVVLFDSQTADTTTGFTDAGGSPVPEPQVPMAGGFFFVNGNPGTPSNPSGTFNWTQVLNP